MTEPAAARPWIARLWWVVPAGLFFVYALSFSAFPGLEQPVGSVLGETDVGAYAIVFREFRPGHKLGDEYRVQNRGNADIAEKHRIHHVITAVAGRAIYLTLQGPFTWVGLNPRRAIYVVSAIFVTINVLLLRVLLRQWNPNGNPVSPFLLFYGLSLGTWLYASVPDSWPVSATLMLLALVALRRPAISPFAVAAGLGIGMLNNMALGSVSLLLWFRLWNDGWRGGRLILRCAAVTGLAVATWAAALLTLSFIDPVYRPDHLLAYSSWFRSLMGATLPPTDPYVWKSIIAGLYLNSLVANQGDLNVHNEALRDTIAGGGLGLVAILGVVTLLGLGAVHWVRAVLARRKDGTPWIDLIAHPDTWPIAFAIQMAFVTLALFYPGGFTYSALVIPMLALFLCRYLDFRRRVDLVIGIVGIGLLVVNNIDQVRRFRAALEPMRVEAVAPPSGDTAR